jgi:DNA-binding response OmpR family regulator
MVKARILVVEDQAATANLIEQVLGGEGYSVQAVNSLEKARAQLKKKPPELMILDRNLPDGDGVDLLASVRGDDKIGALPVIILTAKKDVADKVAGLRTGADDYVAKPFNTEELVGIGIKRRTQRDHGACPRVGRATREQTVDGSHVPTRDASNDFTGRQTTTVHHPLDRRCKIIRPADPAWPPPS